MAKPTKVVLAVVAALLLIAAATLVKLARPSSPDSKPHVSKTSEANTHDSNAHVSTTSSAAPAQAAGSSGTSPVRASPARAAQRAAMLEAIAKARSQRAAAPVGVTRRIAPGAPTGDSTGTTLDIVDKTGDTSDWEKRALGTVNTLLGQCYDLGRAEDPALAGTITVRFTLVGEPDVGALLERVEIVDKGTTITQQTLRDCITQQLYALEVDPPPDGVTVKREISLSF